MEKITRKVTLTGIRPIMFDRFPGTIAKGQELKPSEKLYIGGGQQLVFPAINLLSFLSSQNTESAAKRVIGRGWNAIAKAALSYCDIDPIEIPITRNGQVLTLENSGYQVRYDVARVKKGALSIPSPKERPVLDTPWEITFTLTLFKNADLSESTLKRLFDEGGLSVGLGTFRGLYGKFVVSCWENI